MKTKLSATVLLSALLLASLLVPVSAADDDGGDTIAVLFDFGNGQVAWADVDVDPAMNALNATEDAADQLVYALDVVLDPTYGPYLNGINGLTSDLETYEYWSFWTWNSTSGSWESSSVGAGSVQAESISAIAWLYTSGMAPPVSKPDHRYPAWPSFRHDSANTGSDLTIGPNSLALAWQKDLNNGSIDSNIVAAYGYEYVVVTNLTSESTVFCLDDKGDIIWSQKIGTGYQVASPLFLEGALIVPSANGMVFAFDPLTGNEKWTFDTHSASNTGITSSPIEHGGRIIVAAGNGKLYSLYPNGAEDWNITIAPIIQGSWNAKAIYHSSPAVKDEAIFIGTAEGKLLAVAADGSGELWNISLGSEITGSPVVLSDKVVITYKNGSKGGMAAVDFDGKLIWNTPLGSTSASPVLTSTGLATVVPTGLVMLGFDGSITWNISLGTKFPGAAPTAVNGTVYVVTNEEKSRLVAVSEEGEIYFDQVLAPHQYALSSPTIADGIMFIASDNGNIYAYDLTSIAPTVAEFSSAANGLAYTFTATQNEGGLFKYLWDFGDGTTAAGRSVTHTYAGTGTYNVVLTVSNPNGDELNYQKAINAEVAGPGDIPIWAFGLAIVAIAVALAAIAVFMLRKKE